MLNPFLDSQKADSQPDTDDIPVWRTPAASQMKIDVAVDAEGRVLVVYDKHFPCYIEWIEFDVMTGQMDFITAGGKIQGLGMTIHAPMNKHVARALEVCLICIRHQEIRDMGIVPLVVRNKDGGNA